MRRLSAERWRTGRRPPARARVTNNGEAAASGPLPRRGLSASSMSERRSALEHCSHHDDGNGIATVWIWQPLQIGDDAMAVGSQRYRGSESLPGHQRGVVMRQGRTLVTYFDSGQSLIAPTLAEIGAYASVARPVATELASAPWNQ